MASIRRFSIRELHQQLITKERSAVEIAQQALDQIQALEPALHSFLQVTADYALEQARQVDAKIAADTPAPNQRSLPGSLE